jgi:hypothetical protein
MKRYKAVIVQRIYENVILDIDEDFSYSHDDVKRIMLDEFAPIPNSSNSEIEVCDLEEII